MFLSSTMILGIPTNQDEILTITELNLMKASVVIMNFPPFYSRIFFIFILSSTIVWISQVTWQYQEDFSFDFFSS